MRAQTWQYLAVPQKHLPLGPCSHPDTSPPPFWLLKPSSPPLRSSCCIPCSCHQGVTPSSLRRVGILSTFITVQMHASATWHAGNIRHSGSL